MHNLKVGQKAVDFCLPDANEKEVCLKDYQGKWLVLYFYPKDNTSGCTLEAINFSKALRKLEKWNALVVGISPDSPQSHCNFRDNHDLTITLLSDTNHHVLETYGVWSLKRMYGKEYYGVERSTFLIDPEGTIDFIWRKVTVNGHLEEVLEKLQELQ